MTAQGKTRCAVEDAIHNLDASGELRLVSFGENVNNTRSSGKRFAFAKQNVTLLEELRVQLTGTIVGKLSLQWRQCALKRHAAHYCRMQILDSISGSFLTDAL